MNTNGLAARQFFILTFGLTVGTSILVTPSGLAATAREDAWIGSLTSCAMNMAMVILYIVIAKQYPGRSLFEMLELAFGRWVGKLISAMYLFYFLILAGTLLGNLGFFLTSEVLPDTPIDIVQMLFLAAAVMCARMGVVILARLSELMLPWIIFFFLILTLALIPDIEWHYIMPMFEDGLAPVFQAGFHASMFQELIVMLVFFHMVSDPRQTMKGYWGGTALGHLLLTIVVLFSVLTLGIEQSANSSFPAYALAKTINLGNFLQRIEGILIALWIMTFFLKTMLLIFSMLEGLQNIFGLKSTRYFIYPIAVLLLVVAWNTYINSVYIGAVIEKVWGGYALIHLVFIPVLMSAAAWLRGTGRKPKEEAAQGGA